MEIKYQVFENENLLVQKYQGFFSIESYEAYTRFITGYLASKSIKKVLNDFRELRISNLSNIIPDDFYEKLEKVIKFRKDINQNELKNIDVKLVILVRKALPTIVAHLFTAKFSNENYKYCSNTKDVIQILMLPESFNDLETIIGNLENSFNVDFDALPD